MSKWPTPTVAELQAAGVLLVEDGNHGEYRPRPNEFAEGGTAFIRAGDIADGLVKFASAEAINAVALRRIRKGVGQPGDILFSHKGTVGKLARVSSNAPAFVCSPQTTFWRIRDDARLRRDYLYAFMRSRRFIDQWWARKGETDMADYVSLTAQRQLRVDLPPIDVQRKIGSLTATLDDLIDNNRRRVEVADEMARAVYNEWFVRFRFPGREKVELTESSLGPIPDGWTPTTVGEVLELKYGKALRADARNGGAMAVVGSSGVVGWHDSALIPGPAIVVGRKGNVGSVIWLDGPSWPIDTTYYVKTELPLRFVAEQLRRTEFLNTHAAVPGLSREQAYSKGFVRPTDEVLAKYEAAVAPLASDARALTAGAEQLASIRDLLLPKLVTGQIDVSGLDLDALVEGAVA